MSGLFCWSSIYVITPNRLAPNGKIIHHYTAWPTGYLITDQGEFLDPFSAIGFSEWRANVF